MTDFYKLSPEDRADWRQNPTTQAALEMLRAEITVIANAVLVTAGVAAEASIRFNAGRRDGMFRALDLLESEK